MTEYFGTGSKIGRGRAAKSIELIEAMAEIARDCFPITVRGVCYKLFALRLIASMGRSDVRAASRLLKEAREEGVIPWEYIVDETRELERVSSWRDPATYVRAVRRSYRRDFWAEQPARVEVWSEKGTIRGVLAPVLDEYGVGFRVMHGYSSATTVHDIAEDGDGRELTALYVGDLDPSGMHMSEVDLPGRLEKYDGDHVTVVRIALLRDDCAGLSGFPASDKKGDKRYPWFVKNYGGMCWELDAMDPNDLRERVRENIKHNIDDPEEWERCKVCQKAEQESLQTVLDAWGAAK
jgi:hypothetical protein